MSVLRLLIELITKLLAPSICMTSYKVIRDINRIFVFLNSCYAYVCFVLVVMEVVIVYCHMLIRILRLRLCKLMRLK
jgi:hypothetical protein